MLTDIGAKEKIGPDLLSNTLCVFFTELRPQAFPLRLPFLDFLTFVTPAQPLLSDALLCSRSLLLVALFPARRLLPFGVRPRKLAHQRPCDWRRHFRDPPRYERKTFAPIMRRLPALMEYS